jgi:chemotaxis protein methyltransferase CheR
MQDEECVAFLQWALPRLHRRWPGFRKVRRTTCKRIDYRLRELALPNVEAYRAFLEREPEEWRALEALLPITISSFYRDRAVFDFLGDVVLKDLAEQAAGRGDGTVRAWSIGCASGEEPYSLMLLWRMCVQPSLARPETTLRVLATDVDTDVLERARVGCYAAGSLKQLPQGWLERAFIEDEHGYRLRPEYREGIDFDRQDVCAELPAETFDLVLCRNLVFTYFDPTLQADTLRRMLPRLRPGGAFVIGRGEALPSDLGGLAAWSDKLGVYRRPPSARRC